MVDINWGILQPVDVGGAFEQGLQQGQAQRRKTQYRNALSAYAQNPSEQGLNALLPYASPDQVFNIVGQREKMAQQRQAQDAQYLEQGKKAIGQAALQISRLPPEQRANAWDQQIDFFVQQGYPGLAPYKGRYSEQALQGVLAEAGLTGEALGAEDRLNQISVTPTVPGGSYNIRNNRGQFFDPATRTWGKLGAAGVPQFAPSRAEYSRFVDSLRPDLRENAWAAYNRGELGHVPDAPASQTIDGKTYYQVNGQWYDNPEGR